MTGSHSKEKGSIFETEKALNPASNRIRIKNELEKLLLISGFIFEKVTLFRNGDFGPKF